MASVSLWSSSSILILHIILENSAFVFGMAILPLTQDSTYPRRYESHECSFQVRSHPSSRTVIHKPRVKNFVFELTVNVKFRTNKDFTNYCKRKNLLQIIAK